ncbi:MAG: DUF3152 domain-containing protein, partial [Corynebacterium sp.]|nr:DUF3152 domain-containing protein [Corynebacterium sp.]
MVDRHREAEEFRQMQLRRRRWLGAVGALVFLVTVAVVCELVIAGVGGDDNAGGGGDDPAAGVSASAETGEMTDTQDAPDGPVPGDAPASDEVGELPPGGDVTRSGDGDYHGVGSAGMTAGDPDRDDADTYSFVVEVENGLDTSSFGGGDAFASSDDATLSDPRSWITNGSFAFRHI